jgi:hypothetical protein
MYILFSIKMASVIDNINSVLSRNSKDINGVRQILKTSKPEHKNISTKDLNTKFPIKGYKFVKREGVLQLIKTGNTTKDKTEDYDKEPPKAFLQSARYVDIDDNENDDDENEKDDDNETIATNDSDDGVIENTMNPSNKIKNYKPNAYSKTKTFNKPSFEEQLSSLAKKHAQEKAMEEAEEHAKNISKSLMKALKNNENENSKEDDRKRIEKELLVEERKRIERELLSEERKRIERELEERRRLERELEERKRLNKN